MGNNEIAIFGAGCFWCTEATFSILKGVVSVMPGYTGGTKPNPTYEEVCGGGTGHIEVAKIEFDPEVISYDQLLDVFWTVHNPTTMDRQGNDVGEQYKSAIFYTTSAQKHQAEAAIKKLDQDKVFPDPVVTEVRGLDKFYPAENYHQKYFENNKNAPYCQFVIAPKVAHLREKYVSLLKTASKE